MAQTVILDNDKHRNLRIITTRGAEYGEEMHVVPVIGDELSKVILDFPVYLMKNKETGQFSLNALMGLETGENLYLQGKRWAASYLPLHMRRQPFLLAFTDEEKQTQDDHEAKVALDMDNRRINESQGEAIFNPDGSKTPFLENMIQVLLVLAKGIEPTEVFISELEKHDLIEATELNITFANGEKKTIKGIYALNEDKLHGLNGEVVADMHGRGFLQACYMMLASLGQVDKLVKMKNAKLRKT